MSSEQAERVQVAVVGAGPAGLSAAWAAQAAGLQTVVIERGCVADNIRRYPAQLRFYSTPRLIELADLPLICAAEKPSRIEAVTYYSRFAQAKCLNVRTYETVTGGEVLADGFRLLTRTHLGHDRAYLADRLVLAFGAYDDPNLLGCPGEDLPHVSHFYDEPERYAGRDVLVVGGKGSASEAALQIHRAGGRVTISYRRSRFSGLKYWIEPDLTNRIAEGSITAYLPSVVEAIGRGEATLVLGDRRTVTVAADFVLALTGYQPRLDLFRAFGVAYDQATCRPQFDPETHETNVPGLYLAGCLCAGNIGNEIFIENGRAHGPKIAAHLAESLGQRA